MGSDVSSSSFGTDRSFGCSPWDPWLVRRYEASHLEHDISHQMRRCECKPQPAHTDLLNVRKVILHYLYHIKDVWGKLLQHDASVMQYVDEITVKALKLRASRVCTRDAGDLRAQVLGGTIFSAFSERDRVGIWARLQTVDGLIPSLYALFENLNYLKALAACMTRLVRPSPGDTVSTALFKAFSDINQRADGAVIQITESRFLSSPASSADRADLGVR